MADHCSTVYINLHPSLEQFGRYVNTANTASRRMNGTTTVFHFYVHFY